MFAPVGFGVSYFIFPALFFLFFFMVGVTAIVTRLRARRPQLPALPVERSCAVVQQKRIISGVRLRYQAVFSLEAGENATFLLTRAQFVSLKEGVYGILAHKGNRFLCFEQQNGQSL